MPQLLVVGRVGRPHGLAGEVSVEIWTDFPERFAGGATLFWRRGERLRPLILAGVRRDRDRLLLSFEGVADRGTARDLCDGELCVPAGDAFPAPADFYYAHEIEGWSCEDRQGNRLGQVSGLEQTPASPLLTVRTESGRETLVPFVHGIVVRVDREAKRIVLDPPEGLFDL